MHFPNSQMMKSSFEKNLDEIQPAQMTKLHKAEQRHSPGLPCLEGIISKHFGYVQS